MTNSAPLKRGPARTYRLTIAVRAGRGQRLVAVKDVNATDLKHQIQQMDKGDVLTITRTQ